MLFITESSLCQIIDVEFSSITTDTALVEYSNSELLLDGVVFRNIENTDSAASFIRGSMSAVSISNTLFTDCVMTHYSSEFDTLKLQNVTFRNITSLRENLLTVQRGIKQDTLIGEVITSDWKDITFENIISNGNNLVFLRKVSFEGIQNVTFKNVSGFALDIIDTEIDILSDIKISESPKCIKFSESTILNATGLNFNG